MYSILLVDDERMMRVGMRSILEKSTLPINEIREATDGEDALIKLGEHMSHIIIADIKMPNIDGLELCRRVSKKCPQIAIIIVSGYDDFKYAQEAIKFGIKDYILKPINKMVFLNSIESTIQMLDQVNRFYNIPLNDLEDIADLIVEGIWFSNDDKLKEGIDKTFITCNPMPLHYCVNVQKKVIDMIIRRLMLKIGYTIKLKIDEFTGIEKEELYKWYHDLLNSLKYEISIRKANADFNIIEMSKNYINENFNKDFTLENISSMMGFSSSYFSQLFRDKTGKTFVQYKSEVRMMKARELILRPDKSVTDVAIEVGFNDISHFITTFKKYSGETPTEYRKKRGVGK